MINIEHRLVYRIDNESIVVLQCRYFYNGVISGMKRISKEDWAFYAMLFAAVTVNFSGISVTLMEPDAALYAGVAKHMALTGDYVNLFSQGVDWLDKPHFPFWVSALSFKIFGVSTAAYKLPAILFVMMAAVYTYLLARTLYSETMARISVIILLSAEHLLLSNNDVRAEPYLTGLVIAAIFHFYRSLSRRKAVNVTLGALFTACAIMTKGPFLMIPIAAAIGGELLSKKNWKAILSFQWAFALMAIVVFTLPELWCLYQQFDLHPEKIIFGRSNVSGIRFFLWDSQFGRFMNTGPIKGSGDPFFFLHTLLWAFLPWPVLFYIGLVRKGLSLKRVHPVAEYVTFWGSVITIMLFSLSRFQLPHYMNIVFPLFSILTAQYILSLFSNRSIGFLRGLQYFICAAVVSVAALVGYLFRPQWPTNMTGWLLAVAFLLAVALWICFPKYLKEQTHTVIFRCALVLLTVNIYFNIVLYPSILKYQAGSAAAFYLNTNYPGRPVKQVGLYSYALDFYLLPETAKLAVVGNKQDTLYFVTADAKTTLEQTTPWLKSCKSFISYPVTRLKLDFLRASNRRNVLENRYLMRSTCN